MPMRCSASFLYQNALWIFLAVGAGGVVGGRLALAEPTSLTSVSPTTQPATTEPATGVSGADTNSSPTSYECRWTDEPITIDGRADEPAWKHAQTIEHFVIPWKQRRRSQTA